MVDLLSYENKYIFDRIRALFTAFITLVLPRSTAHKQLFWKKNIAIYNIKPTAL